MQTWHLLSKIPQLTWAFKTSAAVMTVTVIAPTTRCSPSLGSLQRPLLSVQEGPDGHPGGLLAWGHPPLQLHGRRPAAHVAVPPPLHQRLPQADPGGVRLQADLLLPVPEPGAYSEQSADTLSSDHWIHAVQEIKKSFGIYDRLYLSKMM